MTEFRTKKELSSSREIEPRTFEFGLRSLML